MSKPNRRRPRPGTSPSAARPTGAPTVRLPSAPGPAGSTEPTSTGTSAGAPPTAGTPRAPGTTARPNPVRHGRRERQRATYRPSFRERYRTAIIAIAAVVGVALLAFFVFFSASQPAFACSTVWTPSATPAPDPSATPNLGYVQPDMGRDHVAFGNKVTYTYCAPASGSHYNKNGAGPIAARVYGPADNVLPEGWIHNLEHGGLVLLYTGTGPGASADVQAQFKAFYDAFPVGPVCGTPKGNLGPIVARFDQMSSPFEAIVWGRVLPLQTFDTAQILAFWNQWGERTNPEQQCAPPSASPAASSAPSGSAVASPSAGPSATPVSSASPVPSASPASSAAAAPSPS